VVAIVAVAGPWLIGSRDNTGGPATSSGQSSAKTARLTSPPSISRGHIWHWTFAYPSSWLVTDHGTAFQELASIPSNAALGTIGHVSEDCSNFGQPQCSTAWDLVPSSAAITFEFNNMSGAQGENKSWSLFDAETSQPPAGVQIVTVAGVRALFARSSSDHLPLGRTILSWNGWVPDADEILVWEMVDRFDAQTGFKITAAIRGPDVATIEAQVRAIVDSLAYDAPILPLATDAASKKAALATDARLEGWTGSDPLWSCFSSTPGVTLGARITETVTGQVLTQPLDVRCTADVVALPEQIWMVTYTYEWDAGPNHPAGKAVEYDYLTPDQDGSVFQLNELWRMPYIVPPTHGG
jgi:hypothetical protein